MNKQMSLNLFRDALDRAEEQLEAEMTERTLEVTITREQHEKGVARIMAAFRRHAAMKVKRRILIVILAAVLVILTSCTIYVNREKIAAFVEELYHTYIDVSYRAIDENAPTEILEVYLPAYIPEGYELTESHSNSARVRTQWENEDGERISLVQTILTGDLLGWDVEKGEPQSRVVNETTLYCSEYNNATIYMWNDGDYSYRLTVTEDFLLEEIEELITLLPIDIE